MHGSHNDNFGVSFLNLENANAWVITDPFLRNLISATLYDATRKLLPLNLQFIGSFRWLFYQSCTLRIFHKHLHTPLLKVQFCNIVMCSLCCAICHRMFNHYGSFDPLFFILLIFYYCYYFNGKFGQQLVFFQFLFFSFLWFCLHIWFFLFLFLFFFTCFVFIFIYLIFLYGSYGPPYLIVLDLVSSFVGSC